MQKSDFKIDYSLNVLTSFSVPVKWWQFKKIHTLTLPALSETDISSKLKWANITGEINFVSVDRRFLESSRGRSFFAAYIAALNQLTDVQRAALKQHSFRILSYSFDLIIDNKLSHPNPVTLDAFELTGTKQLLHTANALRTAQLSGKKLVFNDESIDGFTEEYACFTDFWQIENDFIELRYEDWIADIQEDADKKHTSFLEAKPFSQQFSRVANDISDYLKKIASALQISINNLDD
jgi:hypothetical protein